VDIFAECQPFKAVCDLERDLGKEVDRILHECRNAEAELLLGKGDDRCSSKRCFDMCGEGALDEPQVCTVDRISGLFECGRGSGSKAWASLVNIEAKCCGEVSQPDFLMEVGHFLPMSSDIPPPPLPPPLDVVHANDILQTFLFFLE
jgi:hypothetical protein